MKNTQYEIEKSDVENKFVLDEPQVLYLRTSNYDRQVLLGNLAKSSMELLNLIVSKTNLTIKTLAETIFEITPKTFLKYKSTNVKLPSRLAELALEIDFLYGLGIDVFGSVSEFNGWLYAENSFFNDHKPVEFLNTTTGISLIRDALKRIEFGATA